MLCRPQDSFNPRPLCRERPHPVRPIHRYLRFQSTPPMQGATWLSENPLMVLYVSIHAPYAGSDAYEYCVENVTGCPLDWSQMYNRRIRVLCRECDSGRFNPRPLCRERPMARRLSVSPSLFQSTPPMQGATKFVLVASFRCFVSIHAPYAGSDGGE